MVETILVELGAGAIQTQQNVTAWLVASSGNRFQNVLNRGFVGRQVWRKTTFVTYGSGQALLVQNLLQRVEHFSTSTHSFTEGRQASGDDHELLHVHAVFSVRATVDDVHHGGRQLHETGATEVTVQRQAGFFSSSTRTRHGDGQNGIGTQTALVFSAIKLNQGIVDKALLFNIQADDGFGDFGIDVLNCLQHALAQVTCGIAVTQLHGFLGAGRGTGGDGSTANHAGFQQNISFYGRVAA